MLAAHRNGGRTEPHLLRPPWDRFTGAKRARRATERELRMLIAHLEASLMAERHARARGASWPTTSEHLEHNVAEHGKSRWARSAAGTPTERALEIVEAERDRLADEREREPAGV